MEKKNLDIISESLFVGFNYLCAFKRDAFVISNIQLKFKKKKKRWGREGELQIPREYNLLYRLCSCSRIGKAIAIPFRRTPMSCWTLAGKVTLSLCHRPISLFHFWAVLQVIQVHENIFLWDPGCLFSHSPKLGLLGDIFTKHPFINTPAMVGQLWSFESIHKFFTFTRRVSEITPPLFY